MSKFFKKHYMKKIMNRAIFNIIATTLSAATFTHNASHEKYQNIIFDIGGVLLSGNPRTLMEEEFKEFNVLPAYLQEAQQSLFWKNWFKGFITKDELIQILIHSYNCDQLTATRLVHTFLNADRPLIQECINLIPKLKAHGYKLYIISNFSYEHYEVFMLLHRELFKNFDGILCSYQIGLLKPDRAIYHNLLQTYNLVPSECLFIDDTAANIAAAEELGIDGIIFKLGTFEQELTAKLKLELH